ncbi:hypothetical protein GCM10025792_37440 [Pseudonocardia tropica]
MDLYEVGEELRRAQAEFHQLVGTASRGDLERLTNGTRWTNRQLLFHMVLGYGVVRTLLSLVRTLDRLGYSRGFAAALNAAHRPFHAINYLGPCLAARLLSPHAMTALLDTVIGSLQRRLTTETERSLASSIYVPTDWDPYFTPTMSVLDVYHFGTQHFDHHRRQLTIAAPHTQS